jgi:hypothetical protein
MTSRRPDRSTLLSRSGLVLCALLLAAPALGNAAQPLPAWEGLTPAQRELLVAPVRDRWNADPDQRARLLEHARRWQAMSPEQRARAHKGVRRWKHMSPEQREQARALYARMRGLDEAGRRALKERWRAMTPAQQKAWVEANPAPERDGGE